jgi:hypothetical protein
MMKPCERCHEQVAVKGERFCAECRKAVLAELNESYLTKSPRYRGAWDRYRTSEQRENERETKYGTDH